MSEMPYAGNDVYEDEFFVVTDDPDEQMVNLAFVERGLVMRFDYAEFLDLFPVIERTRDHVRRRLDNAGQDGR